MKGHFGCFSKYKHDIAPLEEIYDSSAYLRRVKTLLTELLECQSPHDLKSLIGGHEIKPIRPDSKESIRVISIIGDPQNKPFRIDYGNNPVRVYFSFSNTNKLAYIYIIDTKHRFFN